MISRVAESCFWMMRYLERVECCARLLDVNRALVVDVARPELARWRPMLACAGEEERFAELVGEAAFDSAEAVQDYLVWDERCPVSILTSMRWARENCRTIRETASLELWEAINEAWLWTSSPKARGLYDRDRFEFFARFVRGGYLLRGISSESMLREEPYDFMCVGSLLERAGWTARILDVHHQAIATAAPDAPESPGRAALWLAVLRSCSASEAFVKRCRKPLAGGEVAAFLLFEPAHPRSVRHCVDRLVEALGRLPAGPHDPIGEFTRTRAAALAAYLGARSAEAEAERLGQSERLHDVLTRVIDMCALLGSQVHADYFAPLMTPEVGAR